jgi:type I restriction enzyme M protein
MTLHEAIVKVLKQKNTPLSFEQLAEIINRDDLYTKKNKDKVSEQQISLRVRRYNELFIEFGGLVVLGSEKKWRHFLEIYFWILSQLRKEDSNLQDIKFTVASVFFFKRVVDLKYVNISFPPDFYEFRLSATDRMEIKEWTQYLKHIRIDSNDLAIFEAISEAFFQLSSNVLVEIFKVLDEFDSSVFDNENFGQAFEYILLNDKESQYKKSGFISTPQRVSDLMVKVLAPKYGELYDPVCGVGTILTKSLNYASNIIVKGSEINKRTAQLAYMNVLMHGYANPQINGENCFNRIDDQYDYIIGDLPFTGSNKYDINELQWKFNIEVPNSISGFGGFLLLAYSKLKYEGKAVLTVGDSFLYRSSGTEKKIREFLVEIDAIEAVINLPDGALKPYTSAKISLIVLNKNKPEYLRNTIKLIGRSTDNLNFDSQYILDTYHSDTLKYAVSNAEVINFGVLHPNFYTEDLYQLRKLSLEGDVRRLSELAQVGSGVSLKKESLNSGAGIPYIKIENLERDILDMVLSKDSVKDFVSHDDIRRTSDIIKEETLLVAKIGDNLKPTIFKPKEGFEEIVIHQNVLAISLKPHFQTSLEFLYYQFYSDLIINQLKQKRATTTVPFITLGTIKDILVPALDLHTQKNFIDLQKANIIASERNRIEEKFKRLGFKEEAQERELNVVRTITHQLRHNLTGISAIVSKLSSIVDKHNLQHYKQYNQDDPILDVDEGFEAPENMSVQEIIDVLAIKSRSLNNILLDVEKAINLSLAFKKENVMEVLKKVHQHYINENFEIELIGDDLEAEISATHFEDMIGTLISNAKEHSFKNIRSQYKITFTIKADYSNEILFIEYKNNGEPLLITEEEYKSILTKSTDSKGTGIGGFYISKIIEAHHGNLKIDENLKRGVRMHIELPIKQPEYE